MATDSHQLTVGTWTAFKTFVVVLIGFCLSAVLVLILFRPAGPHENYDTVRARARADRLRALHRQEREKLNFYAWADKEKGVARIPIERAMSVELDALKQKPVAASAVPVENPYPYGLQKVPAAPPAGTNAPPTPGAPAPSAPGAEAAPSVPPATVPPVPPPDAPTTPPPPAPAPAAAPATTAPAPAPAAPPVQPTPSAPTGEEKR